MTFFLLKLGSGSAERADGNGALLDFGGQRPVSQTLHGSTYSRGPLLYPSHSSSDSHGNSRPWWGYLSVSTSITA